MTVWLDHGLAPIAWGGICLVCPIFTWSQCGALRFGAPPVWTLSGHCPGWDGRWKVQTMTTSAIGTLTRHLSIMYSERPAVYIQYALDAHAWCEEEYKFALIRVHPNAWIVMEDTLHFNRTNCIAFRNEWWIRREILPGTWKMELVSSNGIGHSLHIKTCYWRKRIYTRCILSSNPAWPCSSFIFHPEFCPAMLAGIFRCGSGIDELELSYWCGDWRNRFYVKTNARS